MCAGAAVDPTRLQLSYRGLGLGRRKSNFLLAKRLGYQCC
jgi:hypothetical protein